MSESEDNVENVPCMLRIVMEHNHVTVDTHLDFAKKSIADFVEAHNKGIPRGCLWFCQSAVVRYDLVVGIYISWYSDTAEKQIETQRRMAEALEKSLQ